jgi:hypothetical protein
MGRVLRTLKHGWNLFQDSPPDLGGAHGWTGSPRTNRSAPRVFNDRSFIGSIYTRLAVDVASVEFYHAKLNKEGIATTVVEGPLNNCLTLDPNIDQTAFALKIDAALTLFEQGVIAIVPVNATMDPLESGSYDIKDLRVGTIAAWHPRKVTLNVYDDREVDDEGNPVQGGVVKQVTVRKQDVAIIENPFFEIMNKPNGLLQRLLAKLALLDQLDEDAAGGKLDLIMQLPYSVRSQSRQDQAKARREELRTQLKDDELGIGYIGSEEKVIQLNRPVVNNLVEQIDTLFKKVMDELGITDTIMNGSADRATINNYFDRTIEPIATAIAQEIKRKFLTKKARTEGHSIEIYRDPLKIIPIDELAEIADKLIRNRVLTVNEMRPKIGFRPSEQEQANQLFNPNMPAEDQQSGVTPPAATPDPQEPANVST